MQTRKLLIAAVILAALSGAVWYTKKHPPSSTPSAPAVSSPTLVNIADASITGVNIVRKDGTTLTLERKNGKWVITAPTPFPADQDAVASLTSSVSPATADSVVDEKPADLVQYGLSQPSVIVTIHGKNGKSDRITFGDDIPAGSLVYARVNADPKVYAVSASVRDSLTKKLSDLRDKRLLTFDSNQLTSIELGSAKLTVAFGKNNQNEWAIVKPQPYRADNFQVEELLRKLTDAKMDLSTTPEDAKKAEAAFAGGSPVAAAKVTDSAGTQSLTLRKNKEDYYAKSSAVAGVFKAPADLGKELEKPLDDFRNKKVFDFGFSDPTKLDVQKGSSGNTFIRSGTDWKRNGQVMEAGAVQSLIDKLRDLSAAKFTSGAASTPEFTVSVVSNDGKRTEKVSFSKNSDGYLASRGNESALYQLDTKAVNDILEASNGIKPAAATKK
ncbi:MAG TPA: DUF4340 domain-containing protein [Bryobacteraceae bacterium]|nr:DUF4340 domain-containing protein [Bryobacteraceae bacterium]